MAQTNAEIDKAFIFLFKVTDTFLMIVQYCRIILVLLKYISFGQN